MNSEAVDGSKPKGWEQFIGEALQLVKEGQKKEEIKNLISEKKYLLSLQAIYSEVDEADYLSFLDQNFNKNFTHNRLHEIILGLDSRIVITTNFDKIYDSYCIKTSNEGFKVITYDSVSLVDEIKSDTRLIIKAHGTIDNINGMIFTRSEYHKMKRNYPNFYDVLKALFITHTVLFIGCSLEDPDVQLSLEDVNIVGSLGKRPHYALILKGSQNQFGLTDWKKTYNIRALEYGPAHHDLIPDLEVLLEQVNQERMIHTE
jgi:hypothetical protein